MNNRFRSAVLTTALLLSTAAAYTQTLPEIAFEEFHLDNGLRVIVHEDRKAPIVAVTVWYHVGSKNETPGRTGFAHLFEHLMFNGSENYDGEYFAPFQEAGVTDINGTTSADRTNYFQTVPTTALDLALWMESDRMGHMLGAIDQAKLDEQRGVVQNEKRQGENEPYGTAYQTLLEMVFPPGHPYSWPVIGSMEDLNAATLEDVYAWFETFYGPNNATLVLAGDIDVATARAKAEHFFGDIPPGPPLEKRLSWEQRELDARRAVIEDRVPQARIYKAFNGPRWASEDSTLIELANYVLVSGKNSRLYRRLVYEDRIATDVGAYALDGEIGGMLVVYASAAPGVDLVTIERALDGELSRLRLEGPTRGELERARVEIESSFIRSLEEVGGFSGKAQTLAQSAVLGGRPDFYRHAFEVLSRATPEDVRRAVDTWMSGNAVALEVVPVDDFRVSSAGGADRSAPPLPETFPAAEFPALEQTTLENGARVIVASRPSIPVVELSLELDAGYAADRPGKSGVASLTLAMLDEGAGSRDALEISDELARLGANLGTGSSLDMSTVSLSALKRNLDASLELFADIVLAPTFPGDELERQRELRLADIREEKTTPLSLALRVLPGLVYGEQHAYGPGLTGTGTEESVAGMTREDLQDFHSAWFRPSNATFIVTGDITLEEIAPRLEALFGGWRDAPVPEKSLDIVEPADAERIFLIDDPAAGQGYILAAQLLPPLEIETEPAVSAMNDVFGGSFTSRINMNLREDKAWSYGARSQVAATAAQRLFLVRAPVQIDRTADSMTEIARELREYRDGRPASSGEVATSIRRSTLTLPGRWETAGAIAADIRQLVRFGLPDDYWDRYPERISGLTAEVVNATIRDLITPDRLTWVVVGDLDVIEDDIRALGFGEVVVLDRDGRILTSP